MRSFLLAQGGQDMLDAVLFGLTERVRELLEDGADPNLPISREGKSALQLAVQQGNADVVELLRQYGAV